MTREKIIPVIWLMLAALIVGSSIGFAARAEAQPNVDPVVINYAQNNAWRVCTVLNEVPTIAGVEGISQAIAEEGLTYYMAGQVIAISVAAQCPWHQDVLDDFIAVYAPKGMKV